MAEQPATGYLPGDPRYGLQGEALKDYYRTKAAQWAIYCWDKPGMADNRRALLAEQKAYVKGFGEREIGYGHFVSDDGRDTLGTSFFMQLDDRAAADAFVAERADEQGRRLPARRDQPLVEQLRQARGRLSPQGHAAVPVHGAEDRHATSSSASTCTRTSHISRRMATASSSAGRSARPMAPTISARRCCWNCPTARRRTSSGTRSRLRRTAVIRGMRGSCGGCLGIDVSPAPSAVPVVNNGDSPCADCRRVSKHCPMSVVFHQLADVSWFECCRPARVLPARPGTVKAIPRDDYADDAVELIRGPTNWRRGFFRLWLLASLIFIVAVAIVASRDIDPQFENLDLPGVVVTTTKFVPVRGVTRPGA